MNGYLKMLMEYKQTEAALRKRIAALDAELKKNAGAPDDGTARRKKLLETELYDLLDVMDKLAEYAYIEEDEQCKGA